MTRNIPSFFSVLLWAVVWEITAQIIQFEILPPPSAILVAAVELVQLMSFQSAFLVSARGFATGIVLAVLFGVPA